MYPFPSHQHLRQAAILRVSASVSRAAYAGGWGRHAPARPLLTGDMLQGSSMKVSLAECSASILKSTWFWSSDFSAASAVAAGSRGISILVPDMIAVSDSDALPVV